MGIEERGKRNEEKGTRKKERGCTILEPRFSNLAPRTSILAPRSCRSGFTLIELMVVIAILSLVVLLVLPRLPSTEAGKLRSSARTLAATIRFLGDRAVTAKSVYRLHLNLTDSTVIVKKLTAAGEEATPDDPFLCKRFIDEGITIEDVIMPRLGKSSDGEMIATFGLGGLAEFMVIHLKDGKDGHFTVIAYPNSGKVKVEAGYQEVEL